MAKFNCSNMPRYTIYTNTYVEKKVEQNTIFVRLTMQAEY